MLWPNADHWSKDSRPTSAGRADRRGAIRLRPRRPEAADPAPTREPTAVRAADKVSRVPFTTRIRADLADAVKRASLERQLQGIEPNRSRRSWKRPWSRGSAPTAT